MKRLTYLLTLILLMSCHQEETTKVQIDVALHSPDNLTSPLEVRVENNTRYAEQYQWTFEGGTPSSSTQKDPGTVTFRSPGAHQITLEASNIGNSTSQTYTVWVDSVITTDFVPQAIINNYAPAEFEILNLSSGGTSYQWTFDGSQTSTQTGFKPQAVRYTQPGTYTITLQVNNGSNVVTVHKEIEVRPTLEATFEITPSFEDIDDMEAPLRARLTAQLQGVETLLWECTGAIIDTPDQADANIYCPTGGTYTVYLNVSNGKQTKRLSQQIKVKDNTNLRTHKDIKLGINTAQKTIGSFYSTKLRRGFNSTEVTNTNGSQIDIAFMGLNASYGYNYFVSPTALSDTPLLPIPNAQATWYVNKIEDSTLKLTVDQFQTMTTDDLLKNLSIKEQANTNYFTNTVVPRIVLFETQDGRKGAILIKEMITNNPENSYILVDIKVQKND